MAGIGAEAVLADNTLHGGGVAGVLLEGNALFTGNVIEGSGNSGNGIWLWKGSAALATGNVIRDFKTAVQKADDARWLEE